MSADLPDVDAVMARFNDRQHFEEGSFLRHRADELSAEDVPGLVTALTAARADAAQSDADWKAASDNADEWCAQAHRAEAALATLRGLLDGVLDQYDRLLEVHGHVVMDTPEDRELHDRTVATFAQYGAVVRARSAALAVAPSETGTERPASPERCPSCASWDPFVMNQPCSLDQYDPDPWHRRRTTPADPGEA